MTPKKFKQMIQDHDLTYEMSDNMRVWKSGFDSLQAIRVAAQQFDEFWVENLWNEEADRKQGQASKQFYWKG